MTIGVLLILFGVQNYQAALSDGEPYAPGIFLLLFVLPGLVLFFLAAILVWWGYRRQQRRSQPAVA
jgi:hypothetical protein